MAHKPLPPLALLNQLFEYDRETGALRWKARPVSLFRDKKQSAAHNAAIWNAKNAGRIACSKTGVGYLETSVFRRRVLAHRVIWKIVTGSDPEEIDHINGDRSDNRWANLRSVPHVVNGRNLTRRRNNTSGVVGVSWNSERHKWVARINPGGRTIYLGLFEAFEDAVAAREAANRHYGYHANHGKPPSQEQTQCPD